MMRPTVLFGVQNHRRHSAPGLGCVYVGIDPIHQLIHRIFGKLKAGHIIPHQDIKFQRRGKVEELNFYLRFYWTPEEIRTRISHKKPYLF